MHVRFVRNFQYGHVFSFPGRRKAVNKISRDRQGTGKGKDSLHGRLRTSNICDVLLLARTQGVMLIG